MTVKELVEKLGLTIFCGENCLDREIHGGYASDLLSDVMGFAKEGNVWVTLQTHKNVIAIASLKEIAAVVLVKNNKPEEDALAQAKEEDIILLGTSEEAFDIVGKIYQLIS